MIENGLKEKMLGVLNWIFGILFLLFAITELLTNIVASIFFFLGSVLLIPATKKWAEKKFNYSISWQVKSITIFVVFIAAISFVDVPKETVDQHSVINNLQIEGGHDVADIEKITTSTEKTETDTSTDIKSEEAIEVSNENNTQYDSLSDEEVSSYTVVSVVDGDTIDVNIDGTIERLRLIGLNTPETVDPRKPVECFGVEASAEAKTILSGRQVRLASDDTQQNRDIYGRLLRYVFLEDGLFYNKYMIEQGFAYEYTYNVPYAYQQEFKNAQLIAQQENRGVWGYDCENHNSEINNSSEGQHDNSISINNTISYHGFYTSGHYSAKLYYCIDDSQWKQLSEKYLEFYETESALLERYPGKILHEPCSAFN